MFVKYQELKVCVMKNKQYVNSIKFLVQLSLQSTVQNYNSFKLTASKLSGLRVMDTGSRAKAFSALVSRVVSFREGVFTSSPSATGKHTQPECKHLLMSDITTYQLTLLGHQSLPVQK